jgi:hypothetical protein
VADETPNFVNIDVEPLKKNGPTRQWDISCLYKETTKIETLKKPVRKAPIIPEKKEEVPKKLIRKVLVIPKKLSITKEYLYADEDGPIYGQKVTAKWKPITYLTKEWVYKGPYTGTRSGIPALVVNRYNTFMLYGDKSVLSQEIVADEQRNIYLKSPNIGTVWPPKTVEDVVYSWTGMRGRIADRNSMGVYQGNDLIDASKIDWERYLYHFIIRYIINGGDGNSVNYINNYGVDYEENRTPDKADPEDIVQVMFKKPVSKKYAGVYKKSINKYSKALHQRLTMDVLPKVSGEELRRTKLVIELLI